MSRVFSLSRKSVYWGIVLGVAVVSIQLAIRHFRVPATARVQTPAQPPAQIPATAPGEGPLPSADAYVPTPENSVQLASYLDGVLVFTLLHEIGHMIISEHHVPVLGREEDAADRFAVMYLSDDAAQRAALLSTASFFNGLHRLVGYDWTDVHGAPQQRAFGIRCLVYGSDPDRYAKLGAQMGVSPDRLQQCVNEAGKNGKDWRDIFQAQANTSGNPFGISVPRVAVVYEPVPPSIADSLSAARKRVMDGGTLEAVGGMMSQMKLEPLASMRRSATDPDPLKQPFSVDKALRMPRPGVNRLEAGEELRGFDYVVRGDACLDGKGVPEPNAYWNSGSRSLTLCYAFINLVVGVGEAQIVERAGATR